MARRGHGERTDYTHVEGEEEDDGLEEEHEDGALESIDEVRFERDRFPQLLERRLVPRFAGLLADGCVEEGSEGERGNKGRRETHPWPSS